MQKTNGIVKGGPIMKDSNSTAPRVLAVTSYLPFPLDRGDPIRVDMYLRALNEMADLTVLATEREDTTDNHKSELARRLPGASVLTFRPASIAPERRYAVLRWISSLIHLTPSWIANRYSRQISEYLNAHGQSFDYCFLIGEAAGQYASPRIVGRVHWDKSNVLTASTRGDIQEVARGSLARMRLHVISLVSSCFERRVLSNVDQVSVTSAFEADRLRELLSRPADFVHSSAVAPVSPAYEVCPGAKVILWMGSFQYHSNTNGLKRFIEGGLPILRSNGYTLRLVGSGASEEYAAELAAIPGIDFRGFVPDLLDAVEGVKVAVVPLWSGAGVKIKTLTLMGLGVPIAGTKTAFEGIRESAALVLNEDPEALAQACVDANASDLVAAQANGFRELESTFSEREFFHRVRAQISSS
jgi:hypothetical protein